MDLSHYRSGTSPGKTEGAPEGSSHRQHQYSAPETEQGDEVGGFATPNHSRARPWEPEVILPGPDEMTSQMRLLSSTHPGPSFNPLVPSKRTIDETEPGEMQPPPNHNPRRPRFHLPSPSPSEHSTARSSNKKTPNNKGSTKKPPIRKPPVRKPPSNKSSPSGSGGHASGGHARQPRPSEPRPIVFVPFEEIAAHTAKCDDCDRRNSDGMIRCLSCGWQCCRKCQELRGGDKTHETVRGQHAPDDEQSTLRNVKPDESNAPLTDAGHASTALVAAEALMRLSTSPSSRADNPFKVESPVEQSSSVNYSQLGDNTGDEYSDASTVDRSSTISWLSDVEEGKEKLEPTLKQLDLLRRNPPRASRPSDMRD